MNNDKRARLGRGLEALIPKSAAVPGDSASSGNDLQRIVLNRIRPNPFQPRRTFQPEELAELQSSLQSSGLLQPITVRRIGPDFELVAGERRLRAATNLGWTTIDAIVRKLDDRAMLALALVENLQRSNLNAIDEARGYRRLIDEFALTQQQVADSVGRDRTTITNLLRVLSLPDAVQLMVEQGTLSSGHARALLALPTESSSLDLARQASSDGWSVRELERRVRGVTNPAESTHAARGGKSASRTPAKADPAVRNIEDSLRRHLQTDVKMNLSGPEKGKIELSFYSNDDLERLLELLLGKDNVDFDT